MKVDGIEVSIESSASKAVAELDKMIAKLNMVSSSIRGINGSGVSGLANGVNGSLRAYSSSASRATRRTFSLAAAFGKFYASCFLIIRGVKSIGKAITSSMDYIESYNYFNVITDKIGSEFGGAWKENGYNNAQEYASSFKDRLNNLTSQMTGFDIGEEGGLYLSDSIGLGLDPEKLMSFQANVSSITNAVGLIGESSVNTSKALTMLSADLSSLKNQSLESVMNSLQSGLIGQSRALYKYGIDITNNTLQHYALANGIEKSVTEMTQAEKMQLRLLAILDQSKVAYGDMASTIDGVANQYRILKQQISNLSRIIGNLFIPVLQAVLPYLNGIVIALQRFFTWIGNLMGIKWDNLMDGISSGYTDTGLEALNQDADNVTDSLEDANKAANKLKNTIHSYDELHVATDNSQDKMPNIGGSGGIDLSNQIADALADYENIWNEAMSKMQNRAQEIADKISAFFNKIWVAIEPLRSAINRLWDEGLAKFANFTWTALKDFYENFLVPIGKWAFGTEDKGITRLIDIINNGLMKIQWEAINKNLKEFWIAIEPYAENFGEGLIDFFEDLSEIAVDVINKLFGEGGTITGLTDWLNDNDPEIARKWGYALGVLLTSVLAFKTANKAVSVISLLTKNLTTIAGLGAISATVFVGVEFAKDAKTWLENIKNLGWDAGRKKSAEDNKANPYNNGNAVIQNDESVADWQKKNRQTGMTPWSVYGEEGNVNPFEKQIESLKKWQEENRKTREEEQKEFDTWWDNVKTTFSTKWSEIESWWNSSGIVSWWENDVSPWFTAEKWGELWSGVKESFATKWGDIVAWWDSTAIGVWWNEHVTPYFEETDWTNLFSVIKSALGVVWGLVVEWWDNSALGVWWNEHVSPYFEETDWTNLFSVIKSALQAAWGLVVEWWESSALSKWWAENVAPYFEDADWKDLFSVIESALRAAWGLLVQWWESSALYKWYEKNVKPWFTNDKWNFEGIKKGLGMAFDAAVKAVKQIWNTFARWLNSKLKLTIPPIRVLGFTLFGGATLDLGKIPTFQTGGFPEDGLFMANHNELLGKFSNGKTAVANNEQIISGIEGGVERAMTNSLMNVVMATSGNSGNQNSNRPIQLILDGRIIAESTYAEFEDMADRGLIPGMA